MGSQACCHHEQVGPSSVVMWSTAFLPSSSLPHVMEGLLNQLYAQSIPL